MGQIGSKRNGNLIYRWEIPEKCFFLTHPTALSSFPEYLFIFSTDPNEPGVTGVSREGRRYSSISEIVPARDRRDVRFQLSSPGSRRDSETAPSSAGIMKSPIGRRYSEASAASRRRDYGDTMRADVNRHMQDKGMIPHCCLHTGGGSPLGYMLSEASTSKFHFA